MKQRLLVGAVWVGGSRILINLIGFAGTILLARLLTPGDFGLVAIATTIMTILSSVTELSLSSALVQRDAIDDDYLHSAFTLNFMRSLAIGAILLILSEPIASLYDDERLRLIIYALAATTVVDGLANPNRAAMLRALVFWQEFAIGVPQKLVGFAVSLVIAFSYHTYWAMVIGTLVTVATGTIMSYIVAPFFPKFRLSRARELFSFSAWLSFGLAVNTLSWRLDQLFIGYFLGKPLLGSYAVGDNLAGLPTREATAPLAQTLFPGFSRLADDTPRLQRAYQLGQAAVCAVAFPVGFGFAVVAQPLVQILMGKEWESAIPVIQVISVVVALQALTSTLQPLAMAKGETRMLFNRDFLTFGVRLPLVLGGMFLGGIAGVLAGRALSTAIGIVINMRFVKQLIGVPVIEQFKANGRSLASAAVMAAVAFLVGQAFGYPTSPLPLAVKLVAMIAVGGIVYIGSTLTLWQIAGKPEGPEHEGQRLLSKILNRMGHP
jgi:O-antigen/teichoic acid export membrane protein